MKKLVVRCVRQYAWIHTSIGLFGNVCFVAGSLLFMAQRKDLGIVLFVAGSTGMLIGNLGNALAMAMERKWQHQQEKRREGG